MLQSDAFARTERLRLLLSHIVTQTLERRNDQLLGKNIAADVFGIDLDDTSDISSVRVEIGRLRARLKQYYATEGATEPVIIEIPKGAYSATFKANEAALRNAARAPDRPFDRVRSLSRSARLAIIAGIAGILALATGAIWATSSTDGPTTSRPLVAVAPIENLSDRPDYIAAGLTTDIVNRIARFDHLIVVSRAATASANRAGAAALSLGQSLNADYQLSGALHDDVAGIRLTFELLNVTDGQVLWVEEFSLPEAEEGLLTARLDAANAVSRALATRDGVVPKLIASDRGGSEAPDRTSYLCVLRYYAYLQLRDPEEHAAVRECLEDATRTSPDYAEVWSGLAQIYLDERRNAFREGSAPGDPLDRAFDAAARAVEIAPGSASAHSVLAAVQYFRRDLDAFRKAARRALELNPNDPDAHAYFGHLLSMSGEWEEGQRLIAEAQEMSPIHPPLWHHSKALAAIRDQNPERALEEARLGEMPQFYMSYVLLAAAHGHLGNLAGATEAIEKLETMRPGYLEAISGDLERRFFEPALIDLLASGVRKAYLLAELP
ncbi:tetratricopeptide repeat protein [Ruegeria marina]|uniref:tetratricopeptide repeat protein n=1 Tax=Ruegeria marina TaxID=639004 RepID=UPI000B86B73A|nr:tetratricopeptide repeat protein [Ruegeria marina]